MGGPRTSHLLATKKVMRYFKGTIGYGILLSTDENETNMKLVAYSGVEINNREKSLMETCLSFLMFQYPGVPINKLYLLFQLVQII
jgi:hypothetical protein